MTWAKKARLWKVAIKHDGETHKLGTFVDAESAARAYDDAARRLRGDKAHGGKPARGSIFWRLNFPTEAEEAAAARVRQQHQQTHSGCPACAGKKRRHTCKKKKPKLAVPPVPAGWGAEPQAMAPPAAAGTETAANAMNTL
eukprot:COSAG04_NODE_1151_length_8058_cov_51.031662_8_plen_141_part_00